MKRLFFLTMAALMILAAVSCDKESKKPQEPVNPLPSTVWTQSWGSVFAGMNITYKATLVFEDKLVRLVFSALDLQLDEMPTIMHGRSNYVFENTSDGGGLVSFSLPIQSINALGIPETTYSGSYNPDSAVLTLNIAEVGGAQPFGRKTFDLIKESKLTTEMNPFPATTWTASWSAGSVLYKAVLAFESSSVNLIITAPDLKVDGKSVILYGSAPYQFQKASGTDNSGNLSFTMSTRSNTFLNLPKTTFSGAYTLDSKMLTLNVSSGEGKVLGTDAIIFARDF